MFSYKEYIPVSYKTTNSCDIYVFASLNHRVEKKNEEQINIVR